MEEETGRFLVFLGFEESAVGRDDTWMSADEDGSCEERESGGGAAGGGCGWAERERERRGRCSLQGGKTGKGAS